MTPTMNWDTQPATEKQLNYLRVFGYEPDRPLTKAEAHGLILQFEDDPERQKIRSKNQGEALDICNKQREENLAYYLHAECDALAKALANAKDREDKIHIKDELKSKQDERLEFWKDTFRSPSDTRGSSLQSFGFYDEFGQFFKMPTNSQCKGVLAALDKHSPTWDLDYPKAFFSTLKENFEELLR